MDTTDTPEFDPAQLQELFAMALAVGKLWEAKSN
jgi:hypothetical protein